MIDGAEGFTNCCTFLKQHGVFPWPIILEKLNTGYRVLDGSHRICAFFYLYGYFNVDNDETPCLDIKAQQAAWIANNGHF